MNKQNVITAVFALSLCSAAGGAELNYRNVELSFASVDINIEEGDHWQQKATDITASWQFGRHLYVLASGRHSGKDSPDKIDQFSVGAGAHWSLLHNLDFYTTASYNFKEDGFLQNRGLGGSIGLRALLAERLELNAGIGVYSLPFSGLNIGGVTFGATYHITDALAAGFNFQKEIGDDYVNIKRVSIRYDFRRPE